jgi:rhodanese-related sulfurtransferase
LAGFELERGSEPQELPQLDETALGASRDRATELTSQFEIARIDRETLASWQTDHSRTLYLFDVRTAMEFAKSHVAGATHAPGGQLVQATDQWVAVRGARIVLSDDTGLRAANTALWLRGMGHDVFVLDEDASACVPTAEPPSAAIPAELPTVSPEALTDRLANGAVLLDLSPGIAYREAHIEGAIWAIRPRLDSLTIPANTDIIFVCRNPGIAELAAIDLRESGLERLARLDGTSSEWHVAGLTVVASPDQPNEDDCIDFLFFVHSRHDGDLDAARRYLEGEVNLLRQVDEQELSTLNPPVSGRELIPE